MTTTEKLIAELRKTQSRESKTWVGVNIKNQELAEKVDKLLRIIEVQKKTLQIVQELQTLGEEPAVALSMSLHATEALNKSDRIAEGK